MKKIITMSLLLISATAFSQVSVWKSAGGVIAFDSTYMNLLIQRNTDSIAAHNIRIESNASNITAITDSIAAIKSGLRVGTNMSRPWVGISTDQWVALGTSVTSTVGLDGYVGITARYLGVTVLNLGLSGSSSGDFVNHYSEIPTLTGGNVDSFRLISFETSINDAGSSMPIATYMSNIQAAIQHAKSKNWPANKILIINGNYTSSCINNKWFVY